MSNLRKAAEELIEAWDWDCSEPRNKALRDLIEALRQALAQPEQAPTIEYSIGAEIVTEKDGFEGCYADACAEAIRARNEK